MVPDEPLFSTLRMRPALAPLTREFALALPEVAADLESSLAADQIEVVRKLAHRLKGSAGGYGFPEIMQVATALEASARAGDRAACAESSRKLARLCERARAGAEGSSS